MAKKKTDVVRYKGGGWYELPDGKKVRGSENLPAPLATQASTLSDRLRFIRRAGFQYQNIRDVYTTAGYVQEGKETFEHFWSLYERDPTAGRIIDMPAKTTWKTPPEVFEGEGEREEEPTDFEEAWDGLVKRLQVWSHFERVDRLCRIGRYAVLFIGTRGSDDQSLKNELSAMQGPEDVLYLSSFAETNAVVKTWETDPGSPRFGLPVLYELNLAGGVEEFPDKKLMVHESRLIHVAEDTLSDDVYGRPALKRALNPLADLLKVSAATGEAYWQLAARILSGKIDPSITDISEEQMTAMGEALEEMVHDLRRQFLGTGVDLNWLSGETPKPSDALEVYKQLMAVASGIPTRILFGSEQGQLASAQDERAYFGMVNERQEHHAEPNILRAFIDRLVKYRALPLPVEGEERHEYTVVWPALFEMSEKEMAEANLTRAKAAKELTAMGGDPLALVEIDKDRNVWLRPSEEMPEPEPLMPPEEEEEVLEEEEEEGGGGGTEEEVLEDEEGGEE
jgi:hypothetical protein